MPDQALSGTRVLDLTHYIAGPYCTKLLADFGAEVIKVEEPGVGDGARRVAPFFQDDPHPEKSGLFHYLNTNKKSITLSLKTRAGVRIFKELVKAADAVVESFSPGVTARPGLDYKALEALNPRLVMTSVSSFGQKGPYRDYRATDIVVWAMGGGAILGGEAGREPLKLGPSISHYCGGLMAAVGTLAALWDTHDTGKGQHVDVSEMEAMIHFVGEMGMGAYSYGGTDLSRGGSGFAGFRGVQPCKDGYIGVNPLTQGHWEALCGFTGLTELMEDPQFLDPLSRTAHRDELETLVGAWLRERSQEELFHSGQAWKIPFALVPTTQEIPDLDQHKARGYFVQIDHPATGPVAQPGAPFKMSEAPWQIRRPAPLLGEHNQEIYGERLGYDPEDLARLRQMGVI